MEHEKHGRPGRPGKHDDRDLHYVFHKLEEIESKIDALGQQGGNPLLAQILTNTEQIMATVAELGAQVTELRVAIDAEQADIAAAFAALDVTIADLSAKIVAGGTDAERQAIADELAAAIADVKSTVADAAPAPPTP